MIFVFDNSSLSKLKHFYPNVFKSVWDGLDTLVKDGSLVSTREVWNELERGEPHPHTNEWLKARRHIFAIPTPEELQFVSTIFAIQHFQALIGIKQQLRGTPVADPFVIAAAKVRNGTVVTEEAFKTNAPKIPNVCDHFKIPCINLEQFMNLQNWVF
jgi:Domain of unknown function (DUF4411)